MFRCGQSSVGFEDCAGDVDRYAVGNDDFKLVWEVFLGKDSVDGTVDVEGFSQMGKRREAK